MQYLRLLQSEW